MKRLVIGIVAHVDAGKTTLSEAILYLAGRLRRLGRVDHGDSFLDTDEQERKRGITILSKQAVFISGDVEFTLLDTPGHIDFSAETERVLQVLDGAVLVVSAGEAVQAHTLTLWKLLGRLGIPTFIFVNKTDLYGVNREKEEAELRRAFGGGCVFMEDNPSLMEQLAECDDSMLDAYFAETPATAEQISDAVGARRLFPCYEGSALKTNGVSLLLAGLETYLPAPETGAEFGAKVFKITRDSVGKRLTWMKLTGGRLAAKDMVSCKSRGWEDKADELRVYSGERYVPVSCAYSGTVLAVTGLSKSEAGDGVGCEAGNSETVLEPVMVYNVIPEDGCDIHALFRMLKQLAEEEPKLSPEWNDRTSNICVSLMGEVQEDILKIRMRERFGVGIRLDTGSVRYKETVASETEGAGHYEPLRHYAEVHLAIAPGEPGSGVRLFSTCSSETLSGNWQRAVLSELATGALTGVLTGSPLTDVRITLTAGRAHPKHTEGGDFRQAAFRALRQGLLKGESLLLEPFCNFTVTLPEGSIGKVMTDLRLRAGEMTLDEPDRGNAVLRGSAPVAEMREYPRFLAAATKGTGRISFGDTVYRPCHNAAEVIARIGYDGANDPEHPADSVFCQNGAGHLIKWNLADVWMHIQPVREKRASAPERTDFAERERNDTEILAIFERTYGRIKPRTVSEKSYNRSGDAEAEKSRTSVPILPECVIVDGYNLIFQWDELSRIAREDLRHARDILIRVLSEYQAYRQCWLILVFDAYRVPGSLREENEKDGFSVVYTKEAETADTYIEKASYSMTADYRVRVVTSDGQVQNVVFGSGALRVSCREFTEELSGFAEQIRQTVAELSEQNARAERRNTADRAKRLLYGTEGGLTDDK